MAGPLAQIALIEHVVAQVGAVVCQRHEPPGGPYRYTYISPSVAQVFGHTAKAFLAEPLRVATAIFGPATDEHNRLGRQARASLQSWAWSGQARHKSGQAMWVDVTATPQRLPGGGLLWNILVVDASARHDAEAQASRAARRLSDIATQLPGEIYRRVLEADGTLRYDDIYGQQQARFGYTQDMLVRDASAFEAMVHPDDRARRRAAIEESARTLTRYDIAYRVNAPDGRVLWCRSIADPVREDGGVVAWNGIVIDITAEKEADAALATSRALLRAVVEALPHPIWAKGHDGALAIWNPAAVRYFGVPEQVALTKAAQSLPPTLADILALSDRQALETGRAASGDRQVVVAERPREFRATSVPYRDRAGATLGTVGIAIDLTDRRQAEGVLRAAKDAAEMANHAKSEFLAHMSHELRTPLNAIIGFSEIMTRELFGPIGADSYKSYAKDIHDSGRHLLRIIDDILNLARIDTGRYEIALEPVALNAVLLDALQVMAPRLRERSLVVENAVGDGAPKALADERALKQVILHVLSNAVKFSPDTAAIVLTLDAADPDILELGIADAGPGIEPARIPSLFTPFRKDMQAAHAAGGPGLGLPVAAKLMDLMGGSIRIDSTLGRGTRVNLRMARARTAAP